jgi:cation diffusion facilitator family transporter
MTTDAGPGKLAPEQASKITSAVTTMSVATAAILLVVKTIAWSLSDSIAILASLADSALDLLASLTIFFAVRYAATPADAEHRYGHGKAEAFAALLQSIFVALSGLYLIVESIDRYSHPQAIAYSSLSIGVMILSIVLTLGLIYFQSKVVKKTGSLAVSGDRAHYISDLLSNSAVIVGLVLAGQFGFVQADPITGFLVALWLIYSAYDLAKESYDNLMDTELPEVERAKIIKIAMQDARLLGVHQLRTRSSGPFVHIQFHADLPPNITLKHAHEILVEMEARLMNVYPAADILIHPDPKGQAAPHGNAYFSTEVTHS